MLVFAKTEDAKHRLQDAWDETEKFYLAVVHGHLAKPEDTISTYLAENDQHVVYSTQDRRIGKLSHTAYRVLRETKEFSLLELNLLTGRKNQIRVHLAGIGHPIVGDKKYGHKDGHKYLALHALSVTLLHPYTGEPLTFEARIPAAINQLVGGVAHDLT